MPTHTDRAVRVSLSLAAICEPCASDPANIPPGGRIIERNTPGRRTCLTCRDRTNDGLVLWVDELERAKAGQ